MKEVWKVRDDQKKLIIICQVFLIISTLQFDNFPICHKEAYILVYPLYLIKTLFVWSSVTFKTKSCFAWKLIERINRQMQRNGKENSAKLNKVLLLGSIGIVAFKLLFLIIP